MSVVLMPVALPGRVQDWPTRLDAAIAAARRTPFHWAQHNCATFAADCVEAITGARVHTRFAGLHRDAAAARRAFHDGTSLEALATQLLGGPGIPPKLAKRGDVVLLGKMDVAALAVCVGAQAACLSEQGVVFVSMEAARCAWPV